MPQALENKEDQGAKEDHNCFQGDLHYRSGFTIAQRTRFRIVKFSVKTGGFLYKFKDYENNKESYFDFLKAEIKRKRIAIGNHRLFFNRACLKFDTFT
jgi:hypothetical protein